MDFQARSEKANLIYESIANGMTALYSRWLDESAHEDIADYQKVIDGWLTPYGVAVSKMTRRPFGFEFALAGATYKVFHTATRYGYKRIA